MKTSRSRYYLGALGILLLLMIGTLWAVVSAQTTGTVTTDKSFVSADNGLSLGTRSVEVTVTDLDLNQVLFVGEGPGGEDADIAEVIIIIDDADAFAAFATPTIDLSTSAAGGEAGVYTIELGDGVVEGDLLPTVDRNADGAINQLDYETATPASDAGGGEDNIGSDEIIVTRVANAEDGRIQLEAQDDLAVGDRFALRFATSSRETTVVAVEGDDPLGTFTMALLETDDASSGQYQGSFVAAETVTLDIGDINGEQFAVAGGSADQVYADEEITVAGAQDIGDAFNITVTNSPIRDTDDDDNLLEEITPESGSVIVTAVVDAAAGTVTVQALQAFDDEDTFNITYNGSRQVNIDLAFAPVQDSNANGADAADLGILLPADQSAGLLQLNAFSFDGAIRFGVTDDLDSSGTVVAISYSGAESQESAGTAAGAAEDVTLDFVPQDLNGDGLDVADVTVLGDWTVTVVSGTRVITITRDGGAADTVAGDEILIQYGVPAPSNPQNALVADPGALAEGDRPVIQASDGGRITVAYDDSDPVITVEAAVDVETDLPSFDNEDPASGSASSDVSGSLSINITDAESGVDTDSVEFRVSITGQAFADASQIAGDDVTTTVTDGTVTASVTLEDVETAVGGDFSVDNLDVDLTWWVTASDDAGNTDTTDSDGDADNDQAFTVNLDTAAPALSQNAFTGDWWNDDDERLEGDRRLGVGEYLPGSAKNTSIRVEFSDELDGDSISASDFTVDGVVADDALHFDESGANVFLVVPALDPDATPEVVLVGVVSDSAGNAVAGGTRTAADGIAPTATLSVSPGLSDGDIEVTVTTDEDIRTPTSGPRLFVQGRDPADPDTELAALGDGIVESSPTASRTTGQNEWSFSLEGVGSTTYTVLVEAEDRDRNRKTVGELDPDADDAVSFEIDAALSTTVDDGASVAPVTSPEDGAVESLTDIFIIEIDWPGEADEYPLDSHNTVSLTKAVLDEGEDNERNLLSEDILLDEDGDDERTLVGEGLARTEDNIEFTIDVPNIGLDDHTLTFNAEDEAGNSLGADIVIDFTVETRPPFELNLGRGINMVSLPGEPTDGDINANFGDVEEVITIFTRGEDNRTLVAFRDPANPGTFIGNLGAIDATRGYGIEVGAQIKVEIDIPPLAATSIPPTVSANGGEWNFLPVISLLPVGDKDNARENEIISGSEIDATAYLGGDWDIAWTFENNGWTSVVPGDAVDVGSAYWVFFSDDTNLNPGVLDCAPLPGVGDANDERCGDVEGDD